MHSHSLENTFFREVHSHSPENTFFFLTIIKVSVRLAKKKEEEVLANSCLGVSLFCFISGLYCLQMVLCFSFSVVCELRPRINALSSDGGCVADKVN